jgi:hypothetical protein
MGSFQNSINPYLLVVVPYAQRYSASITQIAVFP